MDKPKITIEDMKVLCQIIDLASTRGTFRAQELLAIGTIHKKISDIIQEEEKPKTPKEPKGTNE